ncbi:hypothetical protein J2S13_002549 [Oikeobacillus pervagus]|uniref:Uncharacterized protein n=1 Tax=Oikeobacillus pervagus TaxID=1325931 RepID=A0AAJ1T3L4_9BACI|nr:hypothetical protein [Oikeobacillus pervagus]MDQ0216127.1 hypothetical protein [Oikeobacillus pervagus]
MESKEHQKKKNSPFDPTIPIDHEKGKKYLEQPLPQPKDYEEIEY